MLKKISQKSEGRHAGQVNYFSAEPCWEPCFMNTGYLPDKINLVRAQKSGDTLVEATGQRQSDQQTHKSHCTLMLDIATHLHTHQLHDRSNTSGDAEKIVVPCHTLWGKWQFITFILQHTTQICYTKILS